MRRVPGNADAVSRLQPVCSLSHQHLQDTGGKIQAFFRVMGHPFLTSKPPGRKEKVIIRKSGPSDADSEGGVSTSYTTLESE